MAKKKSDDNDWLWLLLGIFLAWLWARNSQTAVVSATVGGIPVGTSTTVY